MNECTNLETVQYSEYSRVPLSLTGRVSRNTEPQKKTGRGG